MGMPVDGFVNQALEGIVAGKDQVNIGAVGEPEAFNEVVDKRRGIFEALTQRMRG